MANINEYTPASGLVVGADGKVYDVTKLLQGQDGDTGLTDDIRRYGYHGGLVVDSNGDVRDITQLIGGGGGGERFVVNISYTGNVGVNSFDSAAPGAFDEGTSCDKTVAEIKAAYDAGKNVVAVITITATGGEFEGMTLVRHAPLSFIDDFGNGDDIMVYFGASQMTYFHGYDNGDYTRFDTVYGAFVEAYDGSDPYRVLIGNPFVEYKHES